MRNIEDEVARGFQQWSTELTAAFSRAGFTCQWNHHTGSSSVRLGSLTVRQSSALNNFSYIVDFSRKIVRNRIVCKLEVYNPVGGLHVHITKFNPATVAKIVNYAEQTIETKIARDNAAKVKDERQKRGWAIYNASLGDFTVPAWASIQPNSESDNDVGTFRLNINDHYRDWPGNRLTLDQAKQIISFIQSSTKQTVTSEKETIKQTVTNEKETIKQMPGV